MNWRELEEEVMRQTSFLDYYQDELDEYGKEELRRFTQVHDLIQKINSEM
jgi:hypothetical protein